MSDNPPLAAFGAVPVTQALSKKNTDRQPERNKYKEFLDAIHSAAFSKENPDEQTRLEWDNIEGEIMGIVLTQDLISGTMLLHIDHPIFKFAPPQKCLDQIFAEAAAEKYLEIINKKQYLVPSVSVMKENLNRLMVSYKGQGRQELIQMLQSFQVSMQEQEHNDPLKQALRRNL